MIILAIPILVGMIVLFAIGVPIFCVLLLACLMYILGQVMVPASIAPISVLCIPIKFFHSMAIFVLLCAPMFMLAGGILNVGRLTDKLIRFCSVFVGHIRGGLAHVNILASMIFAGMSGAAMADATALGSVLIPGMIKEGYEDDFSCAITAGSSLVGPIIPPSVPFIVYGAVSGVSIGALFMGGAIPGILMGIFMMIYVFIIAKRKNFPVMGRRASLGEIWDATKDGALLLGMPAIIIGGIVSGVFTPTEAGAIASLYSLIIACVVYRVLTLSSFVKVLRSVGIFVAAILPLVGVAGVVRFLLGSEQIPHTIAQGIAAVSDNPYVILLLILFFLLGVGMFMGVIASMVMLIGILIPIATNLGIHPIHFGVFVTMVLCIGMNTPPVAEMPYVCATIAKISAERVFRALIPFIIVSVIITILVAYIPALSLFIPLRLM